MLHKSFKPAKCKTTLKLAASRIKLLKNKRDAQVKQLKRELAQLLESGQDQTARIRVEHVVREEKTMAAYELIEIYCELIVARLPIIESQKGCPIDLKEAISSVIFASPRCADIPELMDVRKHFTAKYGKDFVTAAVELRPDCGVSRLLVEKLSAKAPDGPTKVKILSTIAEEHNIKWDPKSFEEKNNPPVDLLNGPNTFEQPTRSPPEVQNIQRPSNSANKVPSNFEVTSQHHEKHDAPSSTFGSRTTHQNLRHGGSEEMEDRYPENREVGSFSMGKQVLKMEFADATAAAQAAAESAERASMAARAAAELSSRGRMSTQPSMEKQNHPAFMSQDDRIQSDLNPRFPGEYNAKQPANDSFDTRDSGKHHHELSDNELNERFYKLKKSNTSHQRIPSKPSGSPVNEYPTDVEDRSSLSRQCTDSERKPKRRFENEKKSDYAASFKEDSRQPSKGFSSHAFGHNREDSMPSEFKPVNKDEETVELESPFVTHEGETQGSSRDSNSQANAAAVFDDSGSDNELVNFDGEENFRNSNYLSSEGGVPSDLLGSTNIWSPSQKASISLGKHDTESPFVLEQQSGSSDLLRSANIWSPRQQAATTLGKSDSQSPFVSEQQPDTITFDESDGENDLNKFTPGEKESSADVSPFRAKEYVGYNRKTELDHSSDDSDVEIHSWKDSRTEIRNEISGNDQSQISQPSNLEDFDKREKETQISSDKYELDTKYVRDSSSEAANELNLGSLKGGLRNKGYKHPPYRRDASNFASTKRASDDASNRIEQSCVRKSETGSEVHDQGQDHQRFHEANREAHSTSTATYIDPDDDDSVDELQKRPSRIAQESFNQRARIDMNNKPYTRTYFDSENSDSEEDTMTPTLTSKHRPVSGVSRRTKAFASDSNRNKTTLMQSETARPTERGVERKSSSRSSYTTGSHHKSESEIGNLGLWGNPEQSQSSEQAAPEKYPVPKESPRSISSSKKHGTESKILDTRRSSAQPSYGDTRKSLDYHGSSAQPSSGDTRSSRRVMESRRSSFDKKLESSGKSTSVPPSTVASSGSAESLKTPSREDSLNQASHVHPKLPDYDTLAAQLLSIRRNRQ